MKNKDKIGSSTPIPAVDPETDLLNAIIETPKGSRNKYAYDEELQLFKLKSVLPAGAAFPFDFGFLPATLGEDGDPLDVLVLLDDPAFPNCLVPARLLGAIEAEQTEDGEAARNDRLIAVADASRLHKDVKTINDLSPNLLHEIEHFFKSYNAIKGKAFSVLGRSKPDKAMKLIREGEKRFKESRSS